MSRDFIVPKHIITGENALSEASLNYGKKSFDCNRSCNGSIKNCG